MDKFSKQIYEAGINDGRAEGKLNTLKILCLYSANEVSSAALVFLIYSHTSSHNNSGTRH